MDDAEKKAGEIDEGAIARVCIALMQHSKLDVDIARECAREDIAAAIRETAREAEQRGMLRERDHIADRLADAYSDGNAVIVADLCDEHLDRSGALLGKIRDIAIERAAKD